jgi:hypothetical protein
MFKGLWWAPVIVFTGLIVSVRWMSVEDAATLAPVARTAKVAHKPVRRTVANPHAVAAIAEAPARPLGATVLMTRTNPLGWSHAYPDKRNLLPPPESVRTHENAIADVTGDGRNDLIALGLYVGKPALDFKVWVYAQTPDGNLAAPVGYRYVEGLADQVMYGGEGGLAVDDFNGDNANDIAVGYSYGIAVLTSNRKGGFTQAKFRKPEQKRLLKAIASIDIDRDGDKDLFGFTAAHDYTLFTNDGRGTFTGQTVLMGVGSDLSYHDHKVVDMDGDGYQDLIVLWHGNASKLIPDYVTIYRNDGTALIFSRPVFAKLDLRREYSGIAAGDFDHDGVMEIVASVNENIPTAALDFLDRGADGKWALAWKVPTYSIPNSLWVGDLDGDGREDLLTDHVGWTQLTAYSNFDFSKEVVLFSYAYSPQVPRVVAVGDLNSDGCKDVAVSDIHAAQTVLWTNQCHRHQFMATDSGWKDKVPQ